MPQYNSPTLSAASTIVAADLVLFYKTALSGCQTITGQLLATGLQALMTFTDTPAILTSNTTLDATYSFVVGNSGGGFTITFPLAASFPGRRFRVGNKGAGALTIARSGSDVFATGAGGALTSTSIAQWFSYEFESDGVGVWFQISK